MFFVTVPAILSALALAAPLFNASAEPHQLQQIRVEGLTNDAFGTVYPAGALEQGGLPLGGEPRYHCQHTCGAGEYPQMIYRYFLRKTIG